jgi:hypothetical protein
MLYSPEVSAERIAQPHEGARWTRTDKVAKSFRKFGLKGDEISARLYERGRGKPIGKIATRDGPPAAIHPILTAGLDAGTDGAAQWCKAPEPCRCD